jgi:hypothetical protein
MVGTGILGCAAGCKAGAAALGVEVILVPQPVFPCRRGRHHRSGNVLNGVTVGRNQASYALRPQRRNNAGRPPAPVETNQCRTRQFERIHEFKQIAAHRALLAGTRRGGRKEARRSVAAQIGHDDPAPRRRERRHHFVEGARIVWKPVHQKHRDAARRPRFLVSYLQDFCAHPLDRRH